MDFLEPVAGAKIVTVRSAPAPDTPDIFASPATGSCRDRTWLPGSTSTAVADISAPLYGGLLAVLCPNDISHITGACLGDFLSALHVLITDWLAEMRLYASR